VFYGAIDELLNSFGAHLLICVAVSFNIKLNLFTVEKKELGPFVAHVKYLLRGEHVQTACLEVVPTPCSDRQRRAAETERVRGAH
jgi:hypothetical protein